MSLTNRFSTLLLVTLSVTLCGFSVAFFVTSRIYLNHQVDERLAAILTLLNSSADTKRGWVRWDARQKRLPPGRWNGRHPTIWLVFDGDGRLMTCPANLPVGELPDSWTSRAGTGPFPGRMTDNQGRPWRVAQRFIRADPSRSPDSERPTDTSEGKSYHEGIQLAAFASLAETESTLSALSWSLFGISSIVFTLTTLCARWLSRKTLVPLTRLVESARRLDASDPGWMLADVGSRDELDDLRRVFNDLLTRLREAYDRQARFSSEASHQLRTPVAVMIGHLEVARRYDRSGEDYRRIIGIAHRRAIELGQVVEALLFLGRADSPTLTRMEPLDLGHSLAAILEGRPATCRSGDIHLRVAPDDVLWVKAQPQLLAQLVENLLDNACKYSRPGTSIVVAVERRGDTASLSVEDSGRGIADEDLPRIFDPFFRSSPTLADAVPGVGLGLSVVRRITAAFGGTIHVESELGRGSRFESIFPLTQAPDLANSVTDETQDG